MQKIGKPIRIKQNLQNLEMKNLILYMAPPDLQLKISYLYDLLGESCEMYNDKILAYSI